MVSLKKRFLAELIGTFFLVYIGAGAAVITLLISDGATSPNPFNIGIGVLGGLGDWLAIGLAFGLTVTVLIYCYRAYFRLSHKSCSYTWSLGYQKIPYK